MTNRSDRFIEILMALALVYSRLFGICNYHYDFDKNKLTYPCGVVAYAILVDLILVVLLPISLWTQSFDAQLATTAKIQRLMSLTSAVAICSSLISQWTKSSTFRTLFQLLTDVRTMECSNLKRNPKSVKKMTTLFVTKIVLSIFFVFATFAASYTQGQNSSYIYIIVSVYFAVIENLIIVVENQFCIGMLYTNYLFEALNDRIQEMVHEILVVSEKRSKRTQLGVLMQECSSLSDELEVIGKMHTLVRSLTTTIKDLFEFQILTILLTLFIAQVMMCFYAIMYLSNNKMNLPEEGFYFGVLAFILGIGNLWLLIYVCGSVVKQCNLGGEHLKLLTAVAPLDCRLEKSIDLLSFQLLRDKFRLRLCGMIDIDWSTGFTMLRACVINLVILVQMDFKNL